MATSFNHSGDGGRRDKIVAALGSLRGRLTLMAALSIGAALFIAWLALGYMFETHIERIVEQDLEARWLELAQEFKLDETLNPSLASDLPDPKYRRPDSGAYWRVSENGRTALRSRSLWDGDITPAPSSHLSPTGSAVEQRGPNGTTVYMMERDVTIEGGGAPRVFQLAVALDTGAVSKLRESFANQVIVALALIGAALSFGAWLQSSFGLRPLKKLRRELALVNNGVRSRLASRFPLEVAPLANDLNRLLARQEDLVRKARERAGDLAHGLKTPLTILHGAARRAEEKGDVETASLLREQIALMRHHIDRELSRARTYGAPAAGGTLTDVYATAQRLIRMFQRMPRGEELTWRNDLAPSLRIRMDPDDFGEVVGNLIDNSRKHATSMVRISGKIDRGIVKIQVDDDGPGVRPDVAERILDRGERAATSGEGFGLGLSIIKEVLEQYDASLEFGDSPLGGCRVGFEIPGVIEDRPAPRPRAWDAWLKSGATHAESTGAHSNKPDL